MTLAAIKARLYRGYHPEDFGGKPMYDGAFRTAYLVGDFVVKQQHKHCGHQNSRKWVREELAALGIKIAQQWTVKRHRNMTWVIQPYYRAVNWSRRVCQQRDKEWMRATQLDVHTDNLGYDKEWNLVAFDY